MDCTDEMHVTVWNFSMGNEDAGLYPAVVYDGLSGLEKRGNTGLKSEMTD